MKENETKREQLEKTWRREFELKIENENRD